MAIVCILPESLGDFLLTTPSLKAIDDAFPDEEKIWLLPDKLLEVAALVPLEARRESLSLASDHKLNLSEEPRITFCFPPAVKYYKLARRIGGQAKAGYAHQKMWVSRITSRFCLNDRWICPQEPLVHELEAYGKILELLGIKFETQPPFIKIPDNALTTTTNWLESKTTKADHKIVGLHLNSRWTCNPLKFVKRNKQAKFLIFFDASEEEIANEMISKSGATNVLVPGPVDLATYSAFLKHCSALIAVDGGPAHLASAVGTPVIVFYPEDRFEYRVSKWHPWGVPFKAMPLAQAGITELPALVSHWP